MSPIDVSGVAPSLVQRIRARHQPLLGGLLVKDGLINQAQLERVLALQREIEPRPLLGQLLLDEKLITPHELNAVLSKYHREHLLGDVLIETNVITPAQLETALAAQRKADAPLGETLIRLGFITERQLKHALSIQLRIAFIDLDDRPIDPELTSLISESYARHHQVVPVARSDDRIVLAMADPTDAELVTELRSCTGYEIDVVTATSDAVGRALSRAYGARVEGPPPPLPRAEMVEPPSREPGDRVAPHGPAPGGAPPKAGASLVAVRTRMDAIRQLARRWEGWADSVETLLRERPERRAEIARLAGDLEESRTALERTRRELWTKTETLTRLETALAAADRDRQALQGALDELRGRHDALLKDRQFAIDHLEAALRRLTS
jgi:hypothetical protein